MRISDWSSDVCSSDLIKEKTIFSARRARGRTLQLEFFLRDARTIALDQQVGIELDTQRILLESLALEEGSQLFWRIEIVHLCFYLISIQIAIIKRRSWTVIDAPIGQNADLLSATIVRKKIPQRPEREREMVDAGNSLIALTKVGHITNRNWLDRKSVVKETRV